MLVVLLVFCISAASVFAQHEGQFTFGARLGPSFGFNSSGDIIPMLRDELFYDLGFRPSISEGMNVNFNFALYGNYAFTDRLSLQAELNFMINQGYELSISGLPYRRMLRIPVLIFPFCLDTAL